MKLGDIVSLTDYSRIDRMTLTPHISMQRSMIVSRSYGVADYFEDEVDLLSYECGNDSEIVARMEMLSKDSEFVEKIDSKTGSDVLTEFNEKVRTRAIDGFIAEIPHEESDNRQ